MSSAKQSGAIAPASLPQEQQNVEKIRRQAERKVRPEIELQRKQAEQQAQRTPDKEAIAVIDETEQAIDAIAADNTSDAIKAIERAIGKINILLARNPTAALIPVSVAVEVIDTAPEDKKAIAELTRLASEAVDDKDLSTARALLRRLISEVRVRAYTLPLATYPDALKEASRLLDQNQGQEASTLLLTALNTLIVVDRASPIPLLLARTAINKAEEQRQKDKTESQRSLKLAKDQIERSRRLGYSGNDLEYYIELNDDISKLNRELSGNADVTLVFSRLKDRLAAFFKRQSEDESLM
jgi:hypothetical protein